jgi:hypothetical protein
MSNYEPPSLEELGSIERLTGGPGGGRLDNILAAIGITIGDGDGGFKPPYGSN